MMANRSPAIPTFIGSTTLSTAAAATAASMALPPPMRMCNPACAARGWLVVTMPCCAITSARLCSFQPSDLSPRTALQAGALGSVLHTESGGSACADASIGCQKAKSSPREQNLRMRMNMGRPPAIFLSCCRPDTIFQGRCPCDASRHGNRHIHVRANHAAKPVTGFRSRASSGILDGPNGGPPMEKKRIPPEAVELYSQFIHGEIDRRAFLDGVKKYAVAGLTATAIVEGLMPNYALGQQVRKDDERIQTSYETVPSPNGNGYIRGYLVRPYSAVSREENPTKLPGVIVVHENRGLNPHTEDVARRFAMENFIAFAPDALSSVGGYPGDDYKGGLLFGKIDGAKRTQDFIAAARWLKSRPDCTGQITATGFCFGGGMANTLAVLLAGEVAGGAPV